MRYLIGSRDAIHIIAEYTFFYALDIPPHCVRSIEHTLSSVALVVCVALGICVAW